jgi:hypothetical protein
MGATPPVTVKPMAEPLSTLDGKNALPGQRGFCHYEP